MVKLTVRSNPKPNNLFLFPHPNGSIGTRNADRPETRIANEAFQTQTWMGGILFEKAVGFSRFFLNTGRKLVAFHVADNNRMACGQGDYDWPRLVNIPLGTHPQAQYEQTSVEIHPGDIFVFYSDGFTEAIGEDDRRNQVS